MGTEPGGSGVITRLEAYGYRSFPQLSLDLGPFHVLAGANGAGKTTLLDIPVLLGDLVMQQRVGDAFLRPQVSRSTPRAHTLIELVHQGRQQPIIFSVEARPPDYIVNAFSVASTT
jgi:predicted ATPase